MITFLRYFCSSLLKPFYSDSLNCNRTLYEILCIKAILLFENFTLMLSGIQKRTIFPRGYCSRNLVPVSAISSAQHRRLEAEELQSPWSFHLQRMFQYRRESNLRRCHYVEFQPKPRHSRPHLQRYARLQHMQYNKMRKSQL